MHWRRQTPTSANAARGDDGRWNRGQPGAPGQPGGKLWERGRANATQAGGRQTGDSNWSRGQALPPAAKGNQPDLLEGKPLQRAENRWVAKQIASGVEAVTKKVQGILNKMTRQTFEKLSTEMCSLSIESSSALEEVIVLVFDKAIEDISRSVSYGEMYADLCVRLSEATRSWSFLRPVFHAVRLCNRARGAKLGS